MAQVDPRYFNWGERFQEGMDQSRQRRLQDIALGQQQEDRAMRLEDRQRAIADEENQRRVTAEEMRRKKLLNMSTGLVRAFEIKQKTGNSAPLDGFWTAIRPELAKDFGQDPGEWNDENIKIAYQILAQSGGVVDEPQQPPQITPYQQAQLDIERQKLGSGGMTPYQKASLDVANRRAAAAESAAAAQATRAESGKADQALQKYTAKLDTNQMPQIEEMLTGVEGMLAQYAGKDVPGFGATGAAPQFMLSEEGQNARQALAGLANTILKSRSGAAVTNPEMARFLTEVGSGALMKDERVRQGIAQIRKWFDEQKRNLAASLPDEAKNRYLEQGGSKRMLEFDAAQPDRKSQFQVIRD